MKKDRKVTKKAYNRPELLKRRKLSDITEGIPPPVSGLRGQGG